MLPRPGFTSRSREKPEREPGVISPCDDAAVAATGNYAPGSVFARASAVVSVSAI
jgi:hypothetical protein